MCVRVRKRDGKMLERSGHGMCVHMIKHSESMNWLPENSRSVRCVSSKRV